MNADLSREESSKQSGIFTEHLFEEEVFGFHSRALEKEHTHERTQ
jgi:hypothetical protein